MMAGERASGPADKTCSACGVVFGCGPGTGGRDGACWCMDLPVLAAIDLTSDCFCPACLQARVNSEALRR